jgi:two-component sensor histidine kinase
MQAPIPCNEPERLAALYRYAILDTPQEQAFDDITGLVASLCQAPIAVINLIDRERQWFKSEIGLGVRETPLNISICAHAILQPGLFIVPDTQQDERFANNPLVCGEPGLRFYAGALLESSDGYPLGTLCVLDYVPRELTEEQQRTLLVLARQVMAQIELRLKISESQDMNERLRRAMAESHHRIKNSFQIITALIEIQLREDREYIPASEYQKLKMHVTALASIHDLLTKESKNAEAFGYFSIKESMNKLLPLLQQTIGTRRIHADVDDALIPLKQGVSLALLVSELVSNAVKHAVGEVGLVLSVSEQTLCLTVNDDGAGFPDDFDPLLAANTGLELVESFARYDLGGTIRYGNRPEGGGQVVVLIPLPKIVAGIA